MDGGHIKRWEMESGIEGMASYFALGVLQENISDMYSFRSGDIKGCKNCRKLDMIGDGEQVLTKIGIVFYGITQDFCIFLHLDEIE